MMQFALGFLLFVSFFLNDHQTLNEDQELFSRFHTCGGKGPKSLIGLGSAFWGLIYDEAIIQSPKKTFLSSIERFATLVNHENVN